MTINRFAKRRDANEPDIIEALQARGAQVETANRPFDLWVNFKSEWLPVEVKLPKGPKGGKRGSKLNDAQKQFIERCKANRSGWAVVRTVEDANALLDHFLDYVTRCYTGGLGPRLGCEASGDDGFGGGGV